jgi:hypothetical protein
MVKQSLIFCLYIAASWLLKIQSSGMFNMMGKQVALCRRIVCCCVEWETVQDKCCYLHVKTGQGNSVETHHSMAFWHMDKEQSAICIYIYIKSTP